MDNLHPTKAYEIVTENPNALLLVTDLEADVVTIQMASLDQPGLIEMLGSKVLPRLRALVG